VLSPADLEAANPNLVGGDPYAGASTLNQFFIFRPIPGVPRGSLPLEKCRQRIMGNQSPVP
jgi:phytoene dehydrogenase-like protein